MLDQPPRADGSRKGSAKAGKDLSEFSRLSPSRGRPVALLLFSSALSNQVLNSSGGGEDCGGFKFSPMGGFLPLQNNLFPKGTSHASFCPFQPLLSFQPDGSCPSIPSSCRVSCHTPLPIKAWAQPQCYQASQSQHIQRSRSSTNMGRKIPFLPIPSHKFNYLNASLLEQEGTCRDITEVNLEPPRNLCDQAH